MSSAKRHFTAVIGSKEHGLYVSSSPSSAARKIVSKLCSSNKGKKVDFYVREITQGSKKKTYGPYLGEMKKLAKPIELKGRVIKYAPMVHLDKKKTTKTTVKKMRGGEIKDVWEIKKENFSNPNNDSYKIEFTKYNSSIIFFNTSDYTGKDFQYAVFVGDFDSNSDNGFINYVLIIKDNNLKTIKITKDFIPILEKIKEYADSYNKENKRQSLNKLKKYIDNEIIDLNRKKNNN